MTSSGYPAAPSALAIFSDDDEQLDFETFMGQNSQSSTGENDIRLVDPVNWDEAFALQRALIPSLDVGSHRTHDTDDKFLALL